MAYHVRNTEHTGDKRSNASFDGLRADAKTNSRRARRANGRQAIAAGLAEYQDELDSGDEIEWYEWLEDSDETYWFSGGELNSDGTVTVEPDEARDWFERCIDASLFVHTLDEIYDSEPVE